MERLTPVTVSKQIELCITAIKIEGTKSVEAIVVKAQTAKEYDKEMAIETLRLKADGTAVTMIKDVARGACSEQLLAKIVGEESLKAHWERLKYLQAQLNGYQSINRHLEHTTS